MDISQYQPRSDRGADNANLTQVSMKPGQGQVAVSRPSLQI